MVHVHGLETALLKRFHSAAAAWSCSSDRGQYFECDIVTRNRLNVDPLRYGYQRMCMGSKEKNVRCAQDTHSATGRDSLEEWYNKLKNGYFLFLAVHIMQSANRRQTLFKVGQDVCARKDGKEGCERLVSSGCVSVRGDVDVGIERRHVVIVVEWA